MPPTPSPTPILIQVVGSGESAPWWGVSLIAGGFLVLGAVLAFVFNVVQDARRTRREDHQRWDARLLEHSPKIVELARKYVEAIRVVYTEANRQDRKVQRARQPGSFWRNSPPSMIAAMTDGPVVQARILALDALHKLAAECAAMNPIAPDVVNSAADALLQEADVSFASGPTLGEDNRMRRHVQYVDLNSAIAHFQQAVRAHIQGKLERPFRGAPSSESLIDGFPTDDFSATAGLSSLADTETGRSASPAVR